MSFEATFIVLHTVPSKKRREIIRDSLESAAKSVPELDTIAPITGVRNFGTASIRELAVALCRWAEREGVLDELFPLDEVRDEQDD